MLLQHSSSRLTVSVVVPTIDETCSLRDTVESLLTNKLVTEVLLITCKRTTHTTRRLCAALQREFGCCIRRIEQRLPHLGGAFRAGVEAAVGSHTLLMFADLESDPKLVPLLIATAQMAPGSIVTASRWLKNGGFVNYGGVKLIMNYFFQCFCRWAFQAPLTDFTYGYRLYPSQIIRSFSWQEVGHAFVLESLLAPHLRGVQIVEVPAVWSARREGVRRSRFIQYLGYLPALLRIAIVHAFAPPLTFGRLADSATIPRRATD